jgi:DNA-binding SARP family transcriptional activator/TolB-like protein
MALVGPCGMAFQGRPLNLKRRKSRALLAYLVLAPDGRLSRAKACALLWSDSDEPSARVALRQSIKDIRDACLATGFSGFHADEHVLWFDMALVETDIDFITTGESSPLVDAAPTEAFFDEFLSDIEDADPAFLEWARSARIGLKNKCLERLQSILASASVNDLDGRSAAQQLLAVDPTHEPAVRYLMKAEFATGNVSGAMRVYQTLWDRLENEFDVEPSSATQRLAIEIKDQKREVDRDSFTWSPSAPSLFAGAAAIASDKPGQRGLSDFAMGRFDFARRFVKTRSGPRLLMLPAPATADNEARHLTEGLLEDVALGLCRYRTFGVVAPYTMRQMPEDPVALQSCLDAMGVDYVVTSRLIGPPSRARVSCGLVETRSQTLLWADEFGLQDGQHRDVMRLARRLVHALAREIDRQERSIALSSQNMNAYMHWLLGYGELDALNLGAIGRAAKHFAAALNEDRNFAPAWSGLARTKTLEWLTLGKPDREKLSEASSYATQALQLDPDDARGFREMGFASLYLRDHDASLSFYEDAKVRNPNQSDLLTDYGDALAHSGRTEEGIELMRTAYDLNPLCGDYAIWTIAGMQYQMRQYAEAVKTIRLMRDDSSAWRLLAASLAQMGEKRQAQDYAERVKRLFPAFSVDNWARIVPNRRREETEHYVEGLRKAGLG